VFEELQEVKVECVPNGRQLMQLLNNYLPDIVFLDLEMPYKNGLECLVEIRSTAATKDLPVVVFSSTSRPSNIQTAYEMGAHLFIYKSSNYLEYAASLKSVYSLDWTRPEKITNAHCADGKYRAFTGAGYRV
jgi:DNA-binding NarL/FixJ family response regulator